MSVNIRVIEDQKVIDGVRDVTEYDLEDYKKKTGYIEEYKGIERGECKDKRKMTFEEMIEENEREIDNMRKKQTAPKPRSFSSDTYDSYSKYGHDSDIGFGFRIDVSSDMKLP